MHDDEGTGTEYEDMEIETDAGNTPEVEEVVELALNTVVGFSTPRTMKLKGKINEKEVVVLVDCGATHNFISQKLVDSLNLPLT